MKFICLFIYFTPSLLKRKSCSSADNGTRPNKPPLHKNNSAGSVAAPKYLWIRLALFDKQLSKIIDHLVQHAK